MNKKALKDLQFWLLSHSIISDILIFFVLILTCYIFTHNVQQSIDVTLYDESLYMYRGVNLPNNGLPDAENAPLYSIWYYFLSFIQPDRVELHYLNYTLMTIFPCLLIYILLRVYNKNILSSLIICWIVLISNINFLVVTKPYHFTLIIVLIAMIAQEKNNSTEKKLLIIASSSLLVSYVRPEMFLCYILVGLYYIIYFIKNWMKSSITSKILMFVFITGSVSILNTIGQPAFKGDSYRSFFAFGQHFSVNWVDWNNSTISPWTNWRQIMTENFGKATSLSEALSNNPEIFVRHIISNFISFPKVLVKLVFHPAIITSGSTVTSHIVEMFITGTFVFLGLFDKNSSLLNRFKDNLSQYKTSLIFLNLHGIPIGISIILIYPRDHYVMMFSVLLLLVMSLLFVPSNQINFRNIMLSIILGVMLLIITPEIQDLSLSNRDNLKTIRTIQSLNLKGDINILEAEGGYNIYMSNNFQRVAEYDKDTTFFDYIEQKKINMIVVSSRLKDDTRFNTDQEWNLFLNEYESLGYTKIPILQSDRFILIQKDLIK